MGKIKGYIASHFFDRGGFLQTEEIADYLIDKYPMIEWYVPQRNDDINNKKENDALITDVKVYQADIQDQLIHSDIVVACLDGVEIDSGVAGEILGKAMQNELEKINTHIDLDLESGESRVRQKNYGLIVGYTTDLRRNKTDREFLNNLSNKLKNLRYNDALEQMENHKENFLYRNIMVTGAVNAWGELVNGYAANNNYLRAVSDVIDNWIVEKGVKNEG